MIVQIADQHALEQKYAAVYFIAPNRERDYVYMVFDNGEENETVEIDSNAIIELAEKLKKRKEANLK